ncbi:hypothetical protein, partial [uncultured Marivita sp.]|uniref:hypothetical protein n=2 Tax=Marivita TaxID=659428 RepID=UPI0025FC3078
MAKDLSDEAQNVHELGIEKAKIEDGVAKLVNRWNQKNIRSAKRLGTFGFMAAALSACNSEGSSEAQLTVGDSHTPGSGFFFLNKLAAGFQKRELVDISASKVDETALDGLLVDPTSDSSSGFGSPVTVTLRDGILNLPEGETYVVEVGTLSDVDALSGAGNAWLLVPSEGFVGGEQAIDLDVSLQGGTLTFDLPDDSYLLNVTGTLALGGGRLEVKDGEVDITRADVSGVADADDGIILNSTLTITAAQARAFAEAGTSVRHGDGQTENPTKVKIVVTNEEDADALVTLLDKPELLGNLLKENETEQRPDLEVAVVDDFARDPDMTGVLDELDAKLAQAQTKIEEATGKVEGLGLTLPDLPPAAPSNVSLSGDTLSFVAEAGTTATILNGATDITDQFEITESGGSFTAVAKTGAFDGAESVSLSVTVTDAAG